MPELSWLTRAVSSLNEHYKPTQVYYGPISVKQFEPLMEALKKVGLTESNGTPSVGMDVYHPSFPNRPEASVTLNSIKGKETTDHFMVTPNGSFAAKAMNTIGQALGLIKRPKPDVIPEVVELANPIAIPSSHTVPHMDALLSELETAGYKQTGFPSGGAVLEHPLFKTTQGLLKSDQTSQPRTLSLSVFNKLPS